MLQSSTEIAVAGLIDPQGELLAVYQRKGFASGAAADGDEDALEFVADAWWQTATASAQGMQRFDENLDLSVPVLLDGEHIGSLLLEADLHALREQINEYMINAGWVSLLVLGLVFAVSGLLQRAITRPLRDLSLGMHEVSEGSDFSLRVNVTSHDETGELTRVFNRMLDQIQRRDEQLQAYREELEQKVEERTADLLEEKEKAEAASRAKSDFLATMSHEIRTPMNGVIGMTELLMQSELGERQHRLAETAHRSAENLLLVINDILDFSKIEAGKLILHNENFDARAALEDAVELLAEQAYRKGLDIVHDLPASMPTPVLGDLVRFRQVLVNLLGNAVKFTDQGQITLARQPRRSGADWRFPAGLGQRYRAGD